VPDENSDDEIVDEGMFDMFKGGSQKGEDDDVITDFFNQIQRGDITKNADKTYKYKSSFIKIEEVSNMVKIYIQKSFPEQILQTFKVSKDVLNNVIMPVLNG